MRILCFFLIVFLLSCSRTQENSSVPVKPEKTRLLDEPQISFNPEQYVCYRSETPVAIDGKMNEKSWQAAAWTDDFVDIQGDLKPKPRFRTRVKMLWDDDYFYIFAEMEEPHVWAALKKRDSIIFRDNDFEVFIDPNGDTHRYYELEINAFGTEWDLFLDKPYRDGNKILFFWDIAGLKSRAHINGTINQPNDVDKGWSLEIAMPWVVLEECAEKTVPPDNGDQWRVNFSRVEWQVEKVDGKYEKVKNPATQKPLPEDNWVWSPQGLINMHYPEMWGFVQFSTTIAGSGSEDFIYNPEEDAKWALRKVYYEERNFFNKNGVYTTKLSDLQLEDPNIENYHWPPVIKCTDNLFEAVLSSINGKKKWHIMQDGKIWQQ